MIPAADALNQEGFWPQAKLAWSRIIGTPVKSLNSPLWLNRIIIALGFLGIFVAGLLSYTHWKGIIPPCGAGSAGCAAVQTHPTSEWFGISVAYFGLAGYLAITGLGIVRSLMAGDRWRKVSLAGLIFSAFGTLASFYLTYVALVQIQATCVWCLTSAGLMTGLFLMHGLLWNHDAPEAASRPEIPTIAMSAVVAIGLLAYNINSAGQIGTDANKLVSAAQSSLFIPDITKVKGGELGKVTLVEFADMNCPSCRMNHSRVKQLVAQFGGRLGYAFRSLPLAGIPGHESSVNAALIAEYMAGKGKYYQWLDKVFEEGNTERVKTLDGLLSLVTEMDMDAGQVRRILDAQEGDEFYDQKSKLLESLAKDVNVAGSVGINQTPTFVLIAEGASPRQLTPIQMTSMLELEPYRTLLAK